MGHGTSWKLKLVAALVAFAAAGIVVATRDAGPPEPLRPRPVVLGEEECGACRMIVSEARFAAERVLGPGEVKVYDDPGCLLRELAGDRSGAVFFADAATGEWIAAADVRFEPTDKPTPMGFGLAATHARRATARALDLEAAIRRLTADRAAREKS